MCCSDMPLNYIKKSLDNHNPDRQCADIQHMHTQADDVKPRVKDICSSEVLGHRVFFLMVFEAATDGSVTIKVTKTKYHECLHCHNVDTHPDLIQEVWQVHDTQQLLTWEERFTRRAVFLPVHNISILVRFICRDSLIQTNMSWRLKLSLVTEVEYTFTAIVSHLLTRRRENFPW